MKKFSLFAALLVAATCAAPARAALLTNPGFETGDLTAWTANTGTLGAVDVVGSATLGNGGTRGPAEGSFFALLSAGEGGVYTTLSQNFVAAVGDTLNLSAYFDTDDFVTFEDDGYVKLINNDDASETFLFTSSVSAVGDFGNTPWTALSHTFSVAGNYTLEAGVRNFDDEFGPSRIGLDAELAAAVVPGPSALVLLCVAAPILGWSRGKRKAEVAA